MKTAYHVHHQTLHATRNGVTVSCLLFINETDARGWLDQLRSAIVDLEWEMDVAEYKRERCACL